MTKEDETVKVFGMSTFGLYYLDAAVQPRFQHAAVLLVNTVEDNMTTVGILMLKLDGLNKPERYKLK